MHARRKRIRLAGCLTSETTHPVRRSTETRAMSSGREREDLRDNRPRYRTPASAKATDVCGGKRRSAQYRRGSPVNVSRNSQSQMKATAAHAAPWCEGQSSSNEPTRAATKVRQAPMTADPMRRTGRRPILSITRIAGIVETTKTTEIAVRGRRENRCGNDVSSAKLRS